MSNLLAIAAGGAIGALARYGVTLLLAHRIGTSFPWGTLAVNGAGSLLLGLLVGLADADPRLPPAAKALVGTGFCGAFTTFSTFSVETVRMPPSLALLNTAANLTISVAAAGVGLWAARALR